METPSDFDYSPEVEPDKVPEALEMLDARMLDKLARLGFIREGRTGEFVRPPDGFLPQIRLCINTFRKYWEPGIPQYRQIWTGRISQEYILHSEPDSNLFNAFAGGVIYDADELIRNVKRYLTPIENRPVID